jgi:hypothetical protein
MANPTPKALHDAATQLRSQATSAQQALDARSTQREDQNKPALHQALVRMETAETVAKRAHENADDVWKQHNDYREQGLKLQEQAQAVAQHGDAGMAADLNRQAADAMQRSENADARYQQAVKEANAADADLTSARAAVNDAGGELQSRTLDPMDAQRQIDLIKEKADTLDQAGRKLELAPTIDNPVERATLELDAEQLLRNAAGIQILTGEITKATGQNLQLPDVDHLQTADATPTGDTGLADPFADDTGAATAGATADQTPDQTADVASPGAPTGTAGTDDTAAASTGATPTGTGSDDAAAAPDAGPSLAAADDPLGMSPSGDDAVAPTAADAGTDDTAFTAAATPDATDTAAADTTGSDVGTDVGATTSFDAPAEPAAADDAGSDFAPDPLADAGSDPGGVTADDSV